MAGHPGHGLWLSTLLTLLREAPFLNRGRVRLWAIAMLIGFAAGLGTLIATAHGGIDYAGRPLGTDFSNVYVAGLSALHGRAADPFDPLTQMHAERALFGTATPFYGWHYPPYFLLIAAPLAALPYLAALALWQGTTLLLYLGAMWLLLHHGPAPALARDLLWPLLALGFTAVFVNLTHGHNGFLTTALLAAGLALLDRRPVAAGILFGLLAYKPQFAVMIPLVLVATARWRTLAAAAATVAALTVLVTMLFGPAIWPAFLASSHFTRVVVLEQGATGFNKIQSVFAWVRLWGGPVPLAYAVQGAVALAVAGALVLLWRSDASPARKGAALCLAAILATPYSLDYDLMILAPAIALLVADGVATGFRPYEKILLTALWLMPIAVRQIAGTTGVVLAVPAMLALFVLLTAEPLRALIPAAHPAAGRPSGRR
ncbi:MAG: glycosyltransferase family 87 protein [Rhizomicrobium sp.]